MDVYRLNKLEKEMEDHLGVLIAQDPEMTGYLIGAIVVDNSDEHFRKSEIYVRHYPDKDFNKVEEKFFKGIRRVYPTINVSSMVFRNMNNKKIGKIISP